MSTTITALAHLGDIGNELNIPLSDKIKSSTTKMSKAMQIQTSGGKYFEFTNEGKI